MMLVPMVILPQEVREKMGPNSKAWVELAHSRPAYKAVSSLPCFLCGSLTMADVPTVGFGKGRLVRLCQALDC
jgi:hypothetical protein